MAEKRYTEQEKILMAQQLGEAFKLGDPNRYITREEMKQTLDALISLFDSKINNVELRQRNWVLGGCLAIILTFGGGYISLISKMDYVSRVVQVLDDQSRERTR